MTRILLAFQMVCWFSILGLAQNPGHPLLEPIGGFLFDKNGAIVTVKADYTFDALVFIKDEFDTTTYYAERHTGLKTGAFGEFTIMAGRGTSFGPDTLDTDLLTYADLICVQIIDPAADTIIQSFENDLPKVARAAVADASLSTGALGNALWNPNALPLPEELVTNSSGWTLPIIKRDTHSVLYPLNIQNLPLNTILSVSQTPAEYDPAIEFPVLNLGIGTQDVINFNQMPLSSVEGQLNLCSRPLNNLFTFLNLKVAPSRSAPLDYPTSALTAANIFEPLGVGVFANGANRGTYSQGQTGTLSLTVGPGNGSGVWARVQSMPASGGFKYGIYAEDQGFDDCFAAYINGDGIYNGTWSQVSDARLKTGIRTAAYGLSTIMKLQPMTYEYVKGTPYQFPDGQRHGFLAQEIENVLPELVTDVVMPKSFDPDLMQTSGTETYKAVNYIELIPILTKAIQDLNGVVENQAKEIAALRAMIQNQKN